MIQVKFLGGAKKLFSTESTSLDESGLTIEDLLHMLLHIKPDSTPRLDTTNILVAVNGTDSSALQGRATILRDGDVVSIIPIIHGGSRHELRLDMLKRHVLVIKVRGKRSYDAALLESLRNDFPGVRLQAIRGRFILNRRHLKQVIATSFRSEDGGALLSNKLETDLLMRFAASRQISEAIKTAGLAPGLDFVLIAVGSTRALDRLAAGIPCSTAPLFDTDNSAFLKRHFGLGKKHLDSVASPDPLADVLAEKAATLLG